MFRKTMVTYILAGFLLFSSMAVLIMISRSLYISREHSIELASRTAALEEEIARARRAENVLGEYGDEILRIEKFFVRRAEPVDFIEELEGLASSTGTALLISPAGEDAAKKFLSLRLEVGGNQEGVLRFLKLLEFLAHDIRVEEMNWESGPARSSLTLRINTVAL